MSGFFSRVRGKVREQLLLSPLTAPIYRAFFFFQNPMCRQRKELIEKHRIDTVLDVGAHIGEYGVGLRNLGFRGLIHSFEPNPIAFKSLERRAKRNPSWYCHPFGLGERDAVETLHILGCSPASSLLKTTELFASDYPQLIGEITQTDVVIKPLDTLVESLCKPSDSVFLKIDAQGYERKILLGAGSSLKQIRLVEFETSLSPLYQGESTLAEMIEFMNERNFLLVGISPHPHLSKTLRQYQADLLFVNKVFL